jgi:hypothetical protein
MRKNLTLIVVFPLLMMLAGCSTLIRAAEKGEINTVKELLEKGADPEEKDSFGDTALMHAAEKGHPEIVKLLLDKGANVNARSNFGDTPLISAARSGNSATVTILLERGAQINAKGRLITGSGDTALSMAALAGKIDIMKTLIDRGADVKEAIFALENTEKQPGYAQDARRGIQELKKYLPEPRQEEVVAMKKNGNFQPQPPQIVEPARVKDLPKVAVWDLVPREVKSSYAQELTSILVSEISKIGQYEAYSQDHVRTLAGWTAEKMQLGCTDTKCLTALGQMDVAKLISGSVGKIGDRYSVSLNLFDTQRTRSERSVSEFCRSENELIESVQTALRRLLAHSP